MVWTTYLCHISVHRGGVLYLLHIKHACIVLWYKDQSLLLSGVLPLPYCLCVGCEIIQLKTRTKKYDVSNAKQVKQMDVYVLVWKKYLHGQMFCHSIFSFKIIQPGKYIAIKLICNEQHCGSIPLCLSFFLLLLSYIICKLGIKGFSSLFLSQQETCVVLNTC